MPGRPRAVSELPMGQKGLQPLLPGELSDAGDCGDPWKDLRSNFPACVSLTTPQLHRGFPEMRAMVYNVSFWLGDKGLEGAGREWNTVSLYPDGSSIPL